MRYIDSVLPPDDDWSTRHSVQALARRTAALVNVLTGGAPSGAPADAAPALHSVADVLRAHGETGELTLSPGDVAEMRSAALLLREVFAAEGVDRAAHALNRLLRERTGALRLTSHDGSTPWHPHLDHTDEGPWGEWFLASACLALTVLVWDRQRAPGGVCASPGCRNVFLTQGSGPARRYCSRRCATRERVAAHRRARAQGEP